MPIRPDEADEWQRLYRERFRSVPAAASVCDARGACFVVEGGLPIGLGAVSGDTLRAVAALERGRGADCVCALAALAQGERLRLTCAAENRSAMRLYDRLGFDAGEAVERAGMRFRKTARRAARLDSQLYTRRGRVYFFAKSTIEKSKNLYNYIKFVF